MGGLLGIETFDLIFYAGIIGIIVSALLGAIMTVLYLISGKRLKSKLDKEYGNPEKYNREVGGK